MIFSLHWFITLVSNQSIMAFKQQLIQLLESNLKHIMNVLNTEGLMTPKIDECLHRHFKKSVSCEISEESATDSDNRLDPNNNRELTKACPEPPLSNFDGYNNIDKFEKWSNKSKDTPFKSSQKCVGNGEEKLAKELDISTQLGGQNSTVDLIHPKMRFISVKDMTNDDCTLGTEGSNEMRKIFRTTINQFVIWTMKYKLKCELANEFYNKINKKYGSSRITIIEGIDRLELSKTNLSKLNELLNELKKHKSEKEYDSLKSEYIDDIVNSLNYRSLQDMLNECVRKEATIMTLIIVDENKGWLIVKDINRLSCPRITRGSPRINYS